MSGGFLSDAWVDQVNPPEAKPVTVVILVYYDNSNHHQRISLSERTPKHPGEAGLMSLPVRRGSCWSMTSPTRSPSITSGTGCATSKRYVQRNSRATVDIAGPDGADLMSAARIVRRGENAPGEQMRHERQATSGQGARGEGGRLAEPRRASPAASLVLPILNVLCCHAARHRLLHQVLRNQRQGRRQCGGGAQALLTRPRWQPE